MGKQKRACFERFRLCIPLLALAVAAAGPANAAKDLAPVLAQRTVGERLKVLVPAAPIQEGGTFFVTVLPEIPVKSVVGEFQEHVIEFYKETSSGDDKSPRFTALVGIEFGTAPGPAQLHLRAEPLESKNKALEEKVAIELKAGEFPSETLSVPPRTVTPSKRDRARIARDREILARAYAHPADKRYWDAPVVVPVNSKITSAYGSSRVYNGVKHNVHLGADMKAPTGTPIHAAISGRVAVARKLFLTGNTVILDHGFGLFTIYAHMSKLKVKEGRLVTKDALLGLSGATGRANGPHLHWGVNLHGTKVDPFLLKATLDQASMAKVP